MARSKTADAPAEDNPTPETPGGKRVRKDRPPLDFAIMTVGTIDPGIEMAKARRRRTDADPELAQVLTIVEAAYDGWLEAGSPLDWNNQPGTYVTVPKIQQETAEWQIRRAGQRLGLKIRFGRPEVDDEDQTATVVFTATDRNSSVNDDDDKDESGDVKYEFHDEGTTYCTNLPEHDDTWHDKANFAEGGVHFHPGADEPVEYPV